MGTTNPLIYWFLMASLEYLVKDCKSKYTLSGMQLKNLGWFSYLSLGIHLAVIPWSLANVTCQLLGVFLQ